jgi:inorganic pyrophosphatase
MSQALEMANNRDGVYTGEKYDYINTINQLKLDLENSQKHNKELSSEAESLREDKKLLVNKIDRLEEVEELYNDLLKEFQNLSANYQALNEEKDIIMRERDSFTKMVQQKDDLLQLQNQQNEKSLTYLHSKQLELQSHSNAGINNVQQLIANNQYLINLQDYLLLQQNIKLLLQLSKEEPGTNPSTIHFEGAFGNGPLAVVPITTENGGIAFSTPAGPILEASNLLLIIREIQEKYSYYKNILMLYENEKILRKELEKKLLNCLQLLKNDEILKQNLQETNNSLTKQVNDLLYLQNLNTSSGQTTSENGAVIEKPDNPFIQQIENLKKENTILKQQLENTNHNYQNSKNELLNTQKVMQKEFAQLWLSIKELTNLDAVKDKSIQELIQERSVIIKERDLLVNKNNMLIEQCNQYQRELRVSRKQMFFVFV